MSNNNEETKALSGRIKELGDKSTQLLLFLSFSFVAVITLKSDHMLAERQQYALTIAMRFWVWALLPILLGILPVKDFSWETPLWYNALRWSKFVFLWTAIVLILFGAFWLGCGIWPVGHSAGTPAGLPVPHDSPS